MVRFSTPRMIAAWGYVRRPGQFVTAKLIYAVSWTSGCANKAHQHFVHKRVQESQQETTPEKWLWAAAFKICVPCLSSTHANSLCMGRYTGS